LSSTLTPGVLAPAISLQRGKARARAEAAAEDLASIVARIRNATVVEQRLALSKCDLAALARLGGAGKPSRQERELLDAVNKVRTAVSIESRVVDTFLPIVAGRMVREKRARRVLDYDDMLRWLSEALEGPRGESLRTQLRARYSYAIVDEFQDTDDLQW